MRCPEGRFLGAGDNCDMKTQNTTIHWRKASWFTGRRAEYQLTSFFLSQSILKSSANHIYIYNIRWIITETLDHIITAMLWKSVIEEEPSLQVVYETHQPVLFSFMFEGAFEKRWKPWKLRHFEIRSNGTLVCRKIRKSAIKAKMDLTTSTFSRIALETDSHTNDNISDQKEFGLCFLYHYTEIFDGVLYNDKCVYRTRNVCNLLVGQCRNQLSMRFAWYWIAAVICCHSAICS